MEGLKVLKKKCTKCGLMLPIDGFSKSSSAVGGFQSVCKNCEKAYYQANKERINERHKAYNQANKEKKSEYYQVNKEKISEYRQANKEKISESQKAYYQANKEKKSEYHQANKEKINERHKAYSYANKEKINERISKRAKADPAFALRKRAASRIVSAVKSQFTEKSHKTKDLLGCDFAAFKKHFEKQFTAGMTWDLFMQGKIHIDHIMPCAKFDLKDEQQQRACFHYKNLQPLWAADNLAKSDKILEPVQMVLGI